MAKLTLSKSVHSTFLIQTYSITYRF